MAHNNYFRKAMLKFKTKSKEVKKLKITVLPFKTNTLMIIQN